MKILYLDCASGVSGDMLLGALVDLGLDLKLLKSRLALMPLKGYSISARDVTRSWFGSRKVDVKVTGAQGHRGLKEIKAIIEGSRLSPLIKQTSMRIFRRIIDVEARIHRIPAQKVHLHEVGAVDAIVDIVGAVIGLDELVGLGGKGGRIVCSALNVGSGTVRMEHGLLPVPAPATVALLKGVPIYSAGPKGEMVTPTGAAIVTTLASSFGPPPAMVVDRVGYGAGSREYDGHPNVLRALLGEDWPGVEAAEGDVMVVECTIDDMNPQAYGYLMERLFASGAREVFYTPVQMKKNRPGVLVTVICPVALLNDMANVIFDETTTIGLRYRPSSRLELARDTVVVATRYGKVRLKISTMSGRVTQVQPEYEDCRKLAARRKVPLKTIQAAALAAWSSAPSQAVLDGRPGR
ncbi:MAG TPA: nickel pincer cofactor biosynthesis protein LarC [Patescibacteria group bacterium]|nr:nickel pincer cofactor biosynthesis protein LarC [Patescibacteria group bacterium]